MIVDDEEDLLYALQKLLSTWYRVDVFTSPVEAIKYAENAAQQLNYYDIILSDIRMQSMDGFEFARIMKKEYPKTKIILMTAFILMKEEFEENKLDIPADDIIVKPFAISQLQITISRLLDMGAADA
jgi:two-component system response regulator YesN